MSPKLQVSGPKQNLGQSDSRTKILTIQSVFLLQRTCLLKKVTKLHNNMGDISD